MPRNYIHLQWPTVLVVFLTALWLPTPVYSDIIAPSEEACLDKEAGDDCTIYPFLTRKRKTEGVCVEYKCRVGPFGPKDQTCLECSSQEVDNADDDSKPSGKTTSRPDDHADAGAEDAREFDSEFGRGRSNREADQALGSRLLTSGPLREIFKRQADQGKLAPRSLDAHAQPSVHDSDNPTVRDADSTADSPEGPESSSNKGGVRDDQNSADVPPGLLILAGSLAIGLVLALIGSRAPEDSP